MGSLDRQIDRVPDSRGKHNFMLRPSKVSVHERGRDPFAETDLGVPMCGCDVDSHLLQGIHTTINHAFLNRVVVTLRRGSRVVPFGEDS